VLLRQWGSGGVASRQARPGPAGAPGVGMVRAGLPPLQTGVTGTQTSRASSAASALHSLKLLQRPLAQPQLSPAPLPSPICQLVSRGGAAQAGTTGAGGGVGGTPGVRGSQRRGRCLPLWWQPCGWYTGGPPPAASGELSRAACEAAARDAAVARLCRPPLRAGDVRDGHGHLILPPTSWKPPSPPWAGSSCPGPCCRPLQQHRHPYQPPTGWGRPRPAVTLLVPAPITVTGGRGVAAARCPRKLWIGRRWF